MKKRVLLSVLTCGLLLGVTTLQAKTNKKVLVQHEIQKQVKNHKQAPKEIVAGMQETFKALQALGKKDTKEATKELEAAMKSFNKALKADPSLDLVPIDERLQAYAFMGTSKVIADRLILAQQLLKAHDTQNAIDVIVPLKDELDITTIAIPMKLYPVAAKKALDALNNGKEKEALDAITEAMNSLVVFEVVLPTPLLAAQDLVAEASKIDKSKKEDAKKLLDAAKEELNRAELLGYTKKHDAAYKLLNDSIEKIEKEIQGKNEVVKLYEKIKNDFKKIIHNTHIEKVIIKNPAEAKVQQYQNNEANKAMSESTVFKQEAQSDKEKTLHNEAKEAVEKFNQKEKEQTVKERKTFEKEAHTDEKKTIQ